MNYADVGKTDALRLAVSGFQLRGNDMDSRFLDLKISRATAHTAQLPGLEVSTTKQEIIMASR